VEQRAPPRTRQPDVKVTVPGAGRLSAAGLVAGRKVATGKTRANAAGSAKLRVRFTRNAAHSLARKRSVRHGLKVAYRPTAGRTPLTAGSALLLKR
jgi:hypothetical protein